MSLRTLSNSVACVLVLAFMAGTGCENTLEPYSSRATYSVWGYLSLSRSQQFIRVKDLDQTLTKDPSSIPELTVTLENLSDGTSETLQDSLVYFTDQGFRIATQNYWTDTPVRAKTTYRLTVEDESGTRVRAETTTPTDTIPTVDPKRGNCLTPFSVEFTGVDDARLVRNVTFVFAVNGESIRIPEDEYPDLNVRNASDSPTRDHPYIRFQPESLLLLKFESVNDEEECCYYDSLCPRLSDLEPGSRYARMTMRFTYLGPEWFGAFSSDFPEYDPLHSLDVENGNGFFGSVRRGNISVMVDTLGRIPVNRCPLGVCNH